MAQIEVDSASIDSRDLENALLSSKERAMALSPQPIEDDGVYGELILLGFAILSTKKVYF